MRVRAAVVIWLIVLALFTSARTRVFQTEASLWTDAYAKAPTKPRPTLNYARTLELAGDTVRAEELYRDVIAQVWDSRRPPYMRLSGQAAAETNIAHIRIKAGKFASAMEILEHTLTYWPNFPYAHYNKATIFWMVGECEEGAHEYDQALTIDPSLTLPKVPCVPKKDVLD